MSVSPLSMEPFPFNPHTSLSMNKISLEIIQIRSPKIFTLHIFCVGQMSYIGVEILALQNATLCVVTLCVTLCDVCDSDSVCGNSVCVCVGLRSEWLSWLRQSHLCPLHEDHMDEDDDDDDNDDDGDRWWGSYMAQLSTFSGRTVGPWGPIWPEPTALKM